MTVAGTFKLRIILAAGQLKIGPTAQRATTARVSETAWNLI